MAGLGGGDGGGDRLIVAHLAHQNNVRVLTQGTAQGAGKAGHISTDLALVNQRLLAAVDVLNRVLNRDDVVTAGLVDVVDHGGQRGGFTAAGGAGDKNQAAGLVRKLGQHGGHRELGQRGNCIAQKAQRGGGLTLLEEHVHTAAGAVGGNQRKVGVDAFCGDGLAVGLVHQTHDEGAGFVHAQLHRGSDQTAVNAEHQGQPLGNMNVAGLHLARQRGKLMNLHPLTPRRT